MKFSRMKLQLGTEVEFGGYQIYSNSGLPVQRPLPRKVTIIQDYPEPQNEPEVKRFLGLCAQFSKFFPDLSHMARPLREKLKKSIDYHLGDIKRQEFDNIKEAITNQMQLVT